MGGQLIYGWDSTVYKYLVDRFFLLLKAEHYTRENKFVFFSFNNRKTFSKSISFRISKYDKMYVDCNITWFDLWNIFVFNIQNQMIALFRLNICELQ